MNKMVSRIVALGGAAVVAFSAAGVTYAQAQLTDCKANQVCVWRDLNYAGSPMGWRSAGGGLVNVSASNDNSMSSYANRTSTNAAWYFGKDGSGTCYTMKAGIPNSWVGNTANDKMSSWRTNRGC